MSLLFNGSLKTLRFFYSPGIIPLESNVIASTNVHHPIQKETNINQITAFNGRQHENLHLDQFPFDSRLASYQDDEEKRIGLVMVQGPVNETTFLVRHCVHKPSK